MQILRNKGRIYELYWKITPALIAIVPTAAFSLYTHGERYAGLWAKEYTIRNTASALVEQLKTSQNTPLLSCLLDGPSGRYALQLAILISLTNFGGFTLDSIYVLKIASCASLRFTMRSSLAILLMTTITWKKFLIHQFLGSNGKAAIVATVAMESDVPFIKTVQVSYGHAYRETAKSKSGRNGGGTP